MSDRPTPERHHMKIEIITGSENNPVAEFFSSSNTQETVDAIADLTEEMKFHHRTHAKLVQTQCQLQDARRERDEAREELARIVSLLLDPHAVFLNFLHGKIARLDWAKLEHIHGPHPARVERDEAREEVRRLNQLLSGT